MTDVTLPYPYPFLERVKQNWVPLKKKFFLMKTLFYYEFEISCIHTSALYMQTLIPILESNFYLTLLKLYLLHTRCVWFRIFCSFHMARLTTECVSEDMILCLPVLRFSFPTLPLNLLSKLEIMWRNVHRNGTKKSVNVEAEKRKVIRKNGFSKGNHSIYMVKLSLKFMVPRNEIFLQSFKNTFPWMKNKDQKKAFLSNFTRHLLPV